MFSSPATPGDFINYNDVHGALLLFNVNGLEEDVPTVHSKPGEKTPAVRADVTVLDGDKKGEHYSDTLVFGRVLQSQLNRKVGELVLGRLTKGVAKNGHSAPWQLTPATPADVAVAEAHMRQVATPQVASAEAPF